MMQIELISREVCFRKRKGLQFGIDSKDRTDLIIYPVDDYEIIIAHIAPNKNLKRITLRI